MTRHEHTYLVSLLSDLETNNNITVKPQDVDMTQENSAISDASYIRVKINNISLVVGPSPRKHGFNSKVFHGAFIVTTCKF